MTAKSVDIAPLNSTVKIVSGQLALSLGLGALVWVFRGQNAGLSAILGGLICVLPNAYLGMRLALTDVRSGAQKLLRSAYIGELIKLIVTVVLFIVTFLYFKPLQPGFLLFGFIASQLALWGSIVWTAKTERETEI